MNPDLCYQEMTDAIERVDRCLALSRKRAVALWDWLASGGAYPSEVSPEEVRIDISQILMRTEEAVPEHQEVDLEGVDDACDRL